MEQAAPCTLRSNSVSVVGATKSYCFVHSLVAEIAAVGYRLLELAQVPESAVRNPYCTPDLRDPSSTIRDCCQLAFHGSLIVKQLCTVWYGDNQDAEKAEGTIIDAHPRLTLYHRISINRSSWTANREQH